MKDGRDFLKTSDLYPLIKEDPLIDIWFAFSEIILVGPYLEV